MWNSRILLSHLRDDYSILLLLHLSQSLFSRDSRSSYGKVQMVALDDSYTFSVIIYIAEKFEGGANWCFTTYGYTVAESGWILATSWGWIGLFVILNLLMVPSVFIKLLWVSQKSPKLLPLLTSCSISF
jgi:hypothetical protein